MPKPLNLLLSLLITGQNIEYYHGTFKISDVRSSSNSGQNSTYQLQDLREMSENLVSQIKFFLS